MLNKEVNNWILEDLKPNDARGYIDLIITNASFDNIQSISYKNAKVYVISENLYKEVQEKMGSQQNTRAFFPNQD